MPPFVHHAYPFAEPDEPPPPIVVLLLHTDLDPPVSPRLLIHQDLDGFVASATKAVTFAPTLQTTLTHTYPPAPSVPFQTILAQPKIPRPIALTRKSIALHVEGLGWGKQKTADIRNCIHILADQLLDTTLSLSHQKPERVEQVFRLAAELYPELDSYEGQWPTDCILMARLKATAASAKTAENKSAVETQAIAQAFSNAVATGAVATRTRGRNKAINYFHSSDVT